VTEAVLIPSAQSDALLHELRRQADAECRTLIESAQREARAIVARAYADARGRMHEAVAALRQEGRRRLLRAKAQAETAARVRAHRRASKQIQAAWPLLETALAARWQDPAGRAQWVKGIARRAAARLSPGHWSIEHPANWTADEQQAFRRMLANRADVEIEFIANAELAEGLRVRAGRSLLDATPAGLLADRAAVAASLLAEVGGADGR
jgi:hypothetical protein